MWTREREVSRQYSPRGLGYYRGMLPCRLRGRVAMVAVAAVTVLGGCGSSMVNGDGGPGGPEGGQSSVTAAMRAACYPPCLANLVKRCPLVSSCLVNLESDINVPLPGESDGV